METTARPPFVTRTTADSALAELQAVYDIVPVGLCVLDTELRWQRINAKMAEINGLPAAAHIGRRVRDLLPTVADAIEPMLRRIIDTGEAVLGIEVTGETPSQPGVRRLWLADYVPMRDADGRVVAINVSAQEITAARAAEEHRRQLLQMIEHSSDFIATADSAGRITYMNKGGRRMIGLPDDADLDALVFTDYVAPASQDFFRTVVIPTAREKGTWDGEMQLFNMRTDAIVDVHRSTFALRDVKGTLVGFATVTRDITAAKAQAAALAESEARFRLLVDRAPAAIAMFDTEMRYLAASRRYLRDYGLDVADGPDALIGRSHYDLFPEVPERWRDIHRRVLAGETLSCDDDPFPREDGHTDWVRWEMAPWHRADGTIGGAILFTEVTTLRKEAELVLARDRDELDRLVRERTHDLEQTQARLAQAEKLTALGQLAGGIAHDFNNVLQTIQGASGLARLRAAEPASVDRLATMIEKAARRGAAVTERLLAFARGGMLAAEPVDPAGLLLGLEELLGHTLGAAVQVRTQVAAGLPHLLADRAQLETGLVNLATNARDAMPDGGTLTVTAALDMVGHDEAPERAGQPPAGRYVRLAVTDTGSGMPPEVLARVAEPFFTTKPAGHGTGLGLAMAKGFAERSGGGFAVESTQGRGTCVTLWLPVGAGPAVAADAVAREAPRAAGDGIRILLVDDDPLVRELTAEQLEAAGFRALSAKGGQAALALLDAGEAVDLLLTDLSMPDLDGIAVIARARQRRPGLPAILLTGIATDPAQLAAASSLAGGFALLRKPISGRKLAENVAALLGSQRD
jgi:PAS domain S-box-containing protein